MAAAGTVGDLYVEGDGGAKVPLGSTPAAPSDVPVSPAAPVAPAPAQPARGVRMADQDASGNVRDTSMEAITQPGRDLHFRNADDETLIANREAKAAEAAKPADAPAPEPVAAPKPDAAPVPEKLYAGKYKSVEDMEKAYTESQRLMHEATEKAARLEREATTRTVAPPVETPEMAAAKLARTQETLQRFVNDPDAFVQQEIIGKVNTALTAQQTTQRWRDANPDLAKHEVRVAFEATLLAQTDPELARDPAALLNKATTQFREFTGLLRTEGAKEALTQETRVIPLSSTTPSIATEHPPQKAPLTPDAAFDQHLRMLKDAQSKSRHGLHH